MEQCQCYSAAYLLITAGLGWIYVTVSGNNSVWSFLMLFELDIQVPSLPNTRIRADLHFTWIKYMYTNQQHDCYTYETKCLYSLAT